MSKSGNLEIKPIENFDKLQGSTPSFNPDKKEAVPKVEFIDFLDENDF
jgi:hypothetical protein